MSRTMIAWVAMLLSAFGEASGAQATTPPPAPQNPSPMAELTRTHERLTQTPPNGTVRTFTGPAAKPVELLIPSGIHKRDAFDLVIHFHGAAWIPQQAVTALNSRTVSATLNLGSGSGVYDRSFTDPATFDTLLATITREVSAATNRTSRIAHVTLTGFSAGHGSIRAILRDPRHFAVVGSVLLIDGMHTSYIPEGRVIALGGTIDTTNLAAFTNFARAAMRGEKQFLITHSEIFPGTFVSTTETADWLVKTLGIQRKPVLRWGPRGTQQLSEARAGKFELRGYAGNSAPDHIDQFHAMPELLKQLRSR
ncbi:MAG: hypothetical protein IT353_07900 [Gemmatimonadaceae bacterium]|nr:hypothetical protein [Gemmatimonadaceae bacterium]